MCNRLLAQRDYAQPHRKFLFRKAREIHDRIAARKDAEIEQKLKTLHREHGTQSVGYANTLDFRYLPRTILRHGTLRRLFEGLQDALGECPDLEGMCGRRFFDWLGLSLSFLKSRQNRARGSHRGCSYLFPWDSDESPPEEFELQSDFRNFLEGSGVAHETAIEVSDIGGGRVDIFVDFGSYRFIAELKRELDDVSPENLSGYLGQVAAYQATDARVSLLMVLDLTDKPNGVPHISENVWVEEFEPNEGDTRWAVVLRVPGNRRTPSQTSGP